MVDQEHLALVVADVVAEAQGALDHLLRRSDGQRGLAGEVLEAGSLPRSPRRNLSDLTVIVIGMRTVAGVGLLMSAFAPLVAVLALVRMAELGWVAWVILAGCALSLLFLGMVLRSVGKLQERTVTSTSVKQADERVIAFSSSQVLPIVVATISPPQVSSFIATLALLAIIVVIYVRAGLFHLNPTLAVLGFHLYEVTASNGTFMLLTRDRHLPQDGDVTGHALGRLVLISLRRNAP